MTTSAMDQLFERSFVQPGLMPGSPSLMAPMDVCETKNGYEVDVALPGVHPENGALAYLVVHHLRPGRDTLLREQYVTTIAPGHVTVMLPRETLNALPSYRPDDELQQERKRLQQTDEQRERVRSFPTAEGEHKAGSAARREAYGRTDYCSGNLRRPGTCGT
jgi:hypothetical protein